jgi:two-component system, OmpR family, phosphate regulon sensor histidine kinase PhoR
MNGTTAVTFWPGRRLKKTLRHKGALFITHKLGGNFLFASLRNRLIATYVVLIFLALLMVGGYLLFVLDRTAENALEEQLRAQGLLLVDMTAEYFPRGEGLEDDYISYLADRTKARITLIAGNGAVLGDSHSSYPDMDNHRNRPEIVQALAGQEGLSTRLSSTTGEEMLYLALPVYAEGRVTGAVRLSLPLTEIRRQGRQQWSLLVSAVLVVMGVTGLISLRLADSLVSPLKPIRDMAVQVAAGQAKEPLRNLRDDEIGQLGRAINEMARALGEKIREVEEGKTRLETVVEHIPGAVIFTDKYKNILLVNGAAEELLGLKRNLIINQRLEKILRDPMVTAQVDKALAGQSRRLSGEVIFPYPERKTMELGGAPVFNSAGTLIGLVMAFHDLTAIRHLEKVRRDFIANVSHELRTPVTSVKGYAETLLDGALEDRDTALEFVHIIHREAGRLSRLITELLEISRMENRQVVFDIKPVNLSEVMRKARDNMLQKAVSEGVQILLALPDNPVDVLADADKLQQVLNNLLENAIRYSPHGGEVLLSFADRNGEDREITVWVSDSGPGIPPADLSRVFERFYRVEKGRSRKEGGSGLGLAIVKHIVEGHGGRVWAENNPQSGATFSFTLRLVQ